MPAVGKGYYDNLNNSKAGKPRFSFLRSRSEDDAEEEAPAEEAALVSPPSTEVRSRKPAKKRKMEGKLAVISPTVSPVLEESDMSAQEFIDKIIELVQKSEMSAGSSQMAATASQMAANTAQSSSTKAETAANKAEAAAVRAETFAMRIHELFAHVESLSSKLEAANRRVEMAVGTAETAAGTAQMAASTAQMAASTAQMAASSYASDGATPPEPQFDGSILDPENENAVQPLKLSSGSSESDDESMSAVSEEPVDLVADIKRKWMEVTSEHESDAVSAQPAESLKTALDSADGANGFVTLCEESSLPRVAPFIFDVLQRIEAPTAMTETAVQDLQLAEMHDAAEDDGVSLLEAPEKIADDERLETKQREESPVAYDAIAELRKKVTAGGNREYAR